jgi:hypothetical protein
MDTILVVDRVSLCVMRILYIYFPHLPLCPELCMSLSIIFTIANNGLGSGRMGDWKLDYGAARQPEGNITHARR